MNATPPAPVFPLTLPPTDWPARVSALAGGPPLAWDRLNWPQLRDLRDAGPGLVVLPVAATEQHGPHLPVGTDTLIADAVTAYASAKAGVPVLPTLAYGVSVGHRPRTPGDWPGTLSLTHETLITAIREMVEWLRTDGWTRVLLVSSHMGNDAPLRCAVDRLRTDHLGALQIGLADTFHLTPEIWARFTDDGADLHANRAETNLVLYLDPASVDHDAMADADDPDRNVNKVFSYPVALTSTNGVTGNPSDASADAGEALLIQMGEALTELLERAKTEEPPLTQKQELEPLNY